MNTIKQPSTGVDKQQDHIIETATVHRCSSSGEYCDNPFQSLCVRCLKDQCLRVLKALDIASKVDLMTCHYQQRKLLVGNSMTKLHVPTVPMHNIEFHKKSLQLHPFLFPQQRISFLACVNSDSCFFTITCTCKFGPMKVASYSVSQQMHSTLYHNFLDVLTANDTH